MANRHKAQALKKGGKVAADGGGNKDVMKEAKMKASGGEVPKKATGGKIEHKASGGAAAPRLDKKARGGANKNPFSSAKVGK